ENEVDTVLAEYKNAVDSKHIENIANFISKYSNKRFNKYRSTLDSAKTHITLLKREMETELLYSRMHPFFINANPADLKVNVKNANPDLEQLIKNYLAENVGELRKVSYVRFPAEISV